MKKFLTVLLALSVVFTYSFSAVGTAFADTDEGTFNGNVNQAQAQVTESLNSSYNNVVKNLTDAEYATGYTASKAAWTSAAELIKDKQLAAITARTNEIKAKYADLQDLTVNEIVALYSEAKEQNGDGEHNFASEAPVLNQNALNDALYADVDVKNAAARADFAEKKAAALSAVDKIDLSIYSTTVDKTTGKSAYDVATEKIASIKKAINAVTITSTAAVSDVTDALEDIGAMETVTYNTTTGVYGDETTTVVDGALQDVVKIVDSADATVVIGYKLADALGYLTTAQEAANATTLEAKKAAYLSRVNANAAQYLANNATATGDTAAKVKAEKDAYVAGMTEIINAATNDSELTAIAATTDAIVAPDNTNFYYTANAALIAELETVAAKYKAYRDADGNLVKDAEAIDAIVAAAKVAAYKANAAWDGKAAAEAAIKDDATNVATISKAAVDAEKAAIEQGRKAALEQGYYAPEEARINALFDKLIAKVDEAKTTAEVEAVYTSYEVLDGIKDDDNKIPTKEDVQDAIEEMNAFKTNHEILEAYKGMLNAGLTASDDGYRDFTAMDDAFFADFYAEKGARTEANVTALLNDAKAALDAVKTKAQLTTDKKDVEDKIATLPATITTANADAVKAAFDAATAYNKAANKTMSNTDISNIATLKLAIAALAKAEKKEITDAVAKIPANVTSADKANIKDLVAKEKAFNEKCATGEIFDGAIAAFDDDAIAALTDKLLTIRGQELQAVTKAIAAIPFNVTEADKATVEAARALYDAYVAEYTDYTATFATGSPYHQNAADDIAAATFKELAEAEATLAAIAKDAEAKAIAAVESLKITASSVAKKGSITVKWTVKGDTAAADGFEVFRSVKRNSGFTNKAFYTTDNNAKRSYKNTKSLKKGTRYYYKVRAYKVVDGVKYYSDWSNKAYRIAK